MTYCFACKDLYPEYSITVGLALDPRSPTRWAYCEDMVYVDSSTWTESEFRNAKKVREGLGYFQKVKLSMTNHAYNEEKATVVVSEASRILRYKTKKAKSKKKKSDKQRRKNRKSK